MTELLINPLRLVRRGNEMETGKKMSSLTMLDKMKVATQVVERWSDYWEEGQGFGSSDYTFMLKEYLEELGAETEFNPCLTIVKFN